MPNLVHQWNKLSSFQVDIKHVLLTGNMTGPNFSDCGIVFGFGANNPHVNASALSVDFKVGGRTGAYTENSDLFKFLFRITQNLGRNGIVVDAPINHNSDLSYAQWGLATWNSTSPGSTFNMLSGEILNQTDDWVQYRMKFDVNHSLSQITLTLTPLATNKIIGNMQAETVVWNFTNPAGSVDGVTGDAQAGLSFATGTDPLIRSNFDTSKVGIGFTANGVVKSCEFSNMQVTSYN